MSKPTTLARATINRAPLLNYRVIALLAASVAAQTQQTPERRGVSTVPQTSSPTPSPAPSMATGDHDLSITANITARELLFEVVPNPTVEFTG